VKLDMDMHHKQIYKFCVMLFRILEEVYNMSYTWNV